MTKFIVMKRLFLILLCLLITEIVFLRTTLSIASNSGKNNSDFVSEVDNNPLTRIYNEQEKSNDTYESDDGFNEVMYSELIVLLANVMNELSEQNVAMEVEMDTDTVLTSKLNVSIPYASIEQIFPDQLSRNSLMY